MFYLKYLFVLNFIFSQCLSCENEISRIFLQIFSEKKIFNVSNFDSIFPTIRYDQNKWESISKNRNVTENCQLLKNLTMQWSKSLINVKNGDNITFVNNYLYQRFLESPCENLKVRPRKTKFSVAEVWIYGLLTVTFINSFAALGILFMPLVKKTFYKSLMTFMVALAVGSLAGTAILILIPDSMKISEMAVHGGFNKNDYKWKATVIFAGLYMFFLTERLFKTIIYKNTKPVGESNIVLADDKCSTSFNNLAIESNGDTVKDLDNDKRPLEEIHAEKALISVSKRIDPVAWMIVFGDAMHNFVDGLSIGAAFSYDVMSGVSVSVAIMCEELPHELGDFAVLISSGMTFKEAMFWNSMSAMTCYLGFVIGVIVGEVTTASVWIFSIAGGMFLYISLVDMMHDIITTLDDMKCSRTKKLTTFALQNLGLWTGYSIILIVALYGDQIQFGS